MVYLVPHVSHFCAFVPSLFTLAPRHSAEVLSSVLKCKGAVTWLTEKMRVLDKFRSGMSCSTVGRGFNVNGSLIHIKWGVFKQKHTQHKAMYGLVDQNAVTRDLQDPNPVIPSLATCPVGWAVWDRLHRDWRKDPKMVSETHGFIGNYLQGMSSSGRLDRSVHLLLPPREACLSRQRNKGCVLAEEDCPCMTCIPRTRAPPRGPPCSLRPWRPLS